MKLSFLQFALVSVLLVVGQIGASQQAAAQSSTETFVARGGLDSNGCDSPQNACATIQGAFSKTSTNGFVNVLGPVTSVGSANINRAVSIVGIGDGARLVSLSNPIRVDIPKSEEVVFDNLNFTSVQNFPDAGLSIVGGGNVTVTNSRFTTLGVTAIEVTGRAGARVLLDNVTIANNAAGVFVKGANGVGNTLFIQRSVIDGNSGFALRVDGAANVAVISDSTLSGSGAAADLSLLNGGRAISYRNNVIRSGTPTQSLPTN